MQAKIELKLKPFTVPNFVLVDESPSARAEGFKEGRKFTLNELDTDTLTRMCDEFKNEVLKKAGKFHKI